ncbi:hypothetical protein EDB81DRAFT_781906 [Dactylonectria macrodidyma]|uniref:Uncharacterized protein n=1 Tax=Dactylonectria macrodidyma TaxID=307937 RepID=A0A9P9FN90_9HYPO|nr:hypothetical protein EDB81DRAFT_781906 [Dactylonectria macrodidyma]
MPHKHKRKRGDDEAEFNLPPTQKARSLPVTLKSSKHAKETKKGKNGKNGQNGKNPGPAQETAKPRGKKARGNDNDVPRAFRRLMAVASGKKVRSGLDDGDDGKSAARAATQDLKILPGEDMRSFAFRVNAALPVAGLAKKTVIKDGKDEAGFKVVRTRKERKMHKLYDQWRAEEQKIQDEREEEAAEAEEREIDDEGAGMTALAKAELAEATTSRKKKKKAGRGQGDDDPWLELKKKRAEARVGLHDTAQAPPELNKKVIKQLKVRGAAVEVDNIPKSAGSLRRREELQGIRADVVDAYRKIREHEQAKLTGR